MERAAYITPRLKAKPFVKWVGGKGQLLCQLEEHLPKELYCEDFTYIEPFVGGGAMLFIMLQKFCNIKRVVINDINRNLTEAYINIKDNAEGLVYRLKHIEQQYFSISDYEGQRNYYLEMRRRFNEENLSSIDKTAILIFLNRTCFNGLYRENSKGKFNVPFGRYTNPTICNED
ncbi:MAG: Dam family site-specific DNA-(adenine-N6)-methyltransferase, partial [Bacteroidales bacterium]|nr:Dam family site-specific DNA-(adenine-N6)-methyltransferase [Bacteroidales bacterium]